MTNTIYIHQPEQAFSFTRLPNFLFEAPTFKPLSNEAKLLYAFGMGGAMDLVNGAKQVIVAMELCAKDGSPKLVKECTLPYTGRRCVDHIVTERCVIDVTPEGLVLSELRRGHSVEEICSAVEPPLIISPELKEMEEDC